VKSLFLSVFFGLLLALGLHGVASANTCAAAVTQGTAPSDYKDYCWLEFSGYSDTLALTVVGQPFTFNLPDGSSLSMTVKTTKLVGTGNPAIRTVAVPSWSGAAFGNKAFIGIPGQTVLYAGVNASTVRVTLSNISVTPPSGGSGIAKYALILGDGESSNNGESLSFTTNGDNWVQLAKIQNGTSTLYPTLAGVGTKTVTETGVSGTVGSYVFGSFNNPTQISADIKSGGLQGIIVGVRYASISVVSQITGVRYSPADQFNYAIKSTSGVTMASGATSGTALSGFTPAGLPTVAASYPFVISEAMAGGSAGALSNYNVALTCVNTSTTASTTVLPTNIPGASYTIASLQYGDAVNCMFSNAPIFSAVAGAVYIDANHNVSQDAGEAGMGVSGLYVKLAPSSGGGCSGPATAAAAVNSVSGDYSLPNVAPGSYCLILDNNSTLSDITAAIPPGWIGVQNSTGVIPLTVVNAPPATPQNFGLYHGSRLTGNVFADTGVGAGGTANNGVQDGSEIGIADVTVNAVQGAAVVTSVGTGGNGSYTLWVPSSVTGAVIITPAAPSGDLATGGSAGTSGGSYSRPSVSYTPVAGQSYSAVNFGLVPPNTLTPNGAQSALPGTVVFYDHTLQAGSVGQVTFNLTNTSIPTAPAWSQVLYQDSNCSGVLDAAEPQISLPVSVTAGQKLCLIVKQFVPAGAALGAQNSVTLGAAFTYNGASPALSRTLTASDITSVGAPGELALTKLVSNLTQGSAAATAVSAMPSDILQYTLTAVNNGTQALNATAIKPLLISDATPAFTTYLGGSALCPVTLPAGLICTAVSAPGASAPGALQWTFTGALAPSAQFSVTYQVRVDQ
jgi:Surface adhesin CshA non-repetitive domain 2